MTAQRAPSAFARIVGGEARGLVLAAVVGALAGVAAAAFLVALDAVTALRVDTPGLVFALPLAGLVIGAVLARMGEPIRGGSNLVVEAVVDGKSGVPTRLAPLVLLGTLATHLFGGSAGREGTAVQMGASLADTVARALRLGPTLRRVALVAGVAGGFGAVFGTPAAGAVFALEFAVRGSLRARAAAPAIVAAVVGDAVAGALGVGHTPYPAAPAVALSAALLARWLVFAAALAAVAVAFIELTHALKRLAERLAPRLPLRMAATGVAVVALWLVAGTDDYLGLGVPTIVRAFDDPTLPAAAFAWKLVFTSVTLAGGFMGGEVTPLFFVGATLGNTLGQALSIPLPLAAGVGFAALFGAAAHAPIALSVLAVELLGAAVLPHVLLVAVLASRWTGHRSIYSAQRSHAHAHGLERLAPDVAP